MRLEDKIPSEAPVRLVNQVIDQLDISGVIGSYKGGGASAYAPRMMLKLIILLSAQNTSVFICLLISVPQKAIPKSFAYQTFQSAA